MMPPASRSCSSSRVRVMASDPNCVERSLLRLALGELIDSRLIRRLMTILPTFWPRRRRVPRLGDARTEAETMLRFVGGLFDVVQDEATRALEPEFGWAILYA